MDNIFDYFQMHAVESFQQSHPRLRFLLKQFQPGQRILNIGIGDGFFEREAEKRHIHIYSLDPSAPSVERLKPLLGDRVQCGVSQSIPFDDNMFDGVVMSEVLEHLEAPILHQTLSEVARILKMGGVFVGTVPARENLQESQVVCPNCCKVFHRWGHFHSFDEQKLRSLLSLHFSIHTLTTKLFISWSSLNWKGKLLGVMKRIAHSIKIRNHNENYFFKVIKMMSA